MKKCFGYVRVSTVKQGEGVSLAAQCEAIEQFAARNDIAITKWFEEKETAAKAGRPVFASMLRLLKRRKADGVVMHKIDRSARNFADWAKIGDLADAGIDVHFATESLDFRSRGGRLSADIQAVIAADYIRNLRDETIKGLNGRLNQGLYPFKAPIGYRDNGRGKPKTPDLLRAPLVRQMFELYGSGQHSLLTLQAEMKRRGLVNDRGMPLTKGGVEKVLRNPFYYGLIRVSTTGETYPGIHQPLISASLFEQVQLLRAGKAGKKVVKHSHAYRGLFRCRQCSSMMTPELQKGHVYYRCHQTECPANCVREETITGAVVNLLSKMCFSDEATERLLQTAEQHWLTTDRHDPAKALGLQLSQLDARLDRLTDAVIDNVIDHDAYLARKEKLLTEKRKFQEKMEELAGRDDDRVHLRRFFELVKSLKNIFISALPSERREIVEIATSNRTVLGKNVQLEPANWLQAAECALAAYCGDLHRPTFRRSSKLQQEQIWTLINVACSKELAAISNIARPLAEPTTQNTTETHPQRRSTRRRS